MQTSVHKSARWILGLIAAGFLAISITGCSTQDISAATIPHAEGRFVEAAAAARELDGDDNDDGVWILLEKGKILYDSGAFAESRATFTECSVILDERCKELGDEGVSVGGIAAVGANTLGDDRGLPYLGTIYDAVLLETYGALAAAGAGNADGAKVSIVRQGERQQEALTIHEKRLKAIQQAEKQGKEKLATVKEIQSTDGKSTLKGDELAARVQKEGDEAWGNLPKVGARNEGHTLVPFALYVAVLLAKELGDEGTAIERLRHLKRVTLGQNAAVKNLESQVQAHKPTTYVIFENGRAAWREERRFGGGITANSIPVATLVSQQSSAQAQGLMVAGSGQCHLLCSLDEIKGVEFAEALPAMRGRAIAAWITKHVMMVAGATVAANSDSSGGQLAGIGLFLAGAIAQAAAGADLRTWQTLPGEYQVLAIPTPNAPELSLTTTGPNEKNHKCTITPGKSNIVLVRSVSAGHLSVQTFAINKGTPAQ